jgi:hypothetical protein
MFVSEFFQALARGAQLFTELVVGDLDAASVRSLCTASD